MYEIMYLALTDHVFSKRKPQIKYTITNFFVSNSYLVSIFIDVILFCQI